MSRSTARTWAHRSRACRRSSWTCIRSRRSHCRSRTICRGPAAAHRRCRRILPETPEAPPPPARPPPEPCRVRCAATAPPAATDARVIAWPGPPVPPRPATPAAPAARAAPSPPSRRRVARSSQRRPSRRCPFRLASKTTSCSQEVEPPPEPHADAAMPDATTGAREEAAARGEPPPRRRQRLRVTSAAASTSVACSVSARS